MIKIKMTAKILVGPKVPIPEVDKCIGEYFFERCGKFNDRIFQINVDTEEKETFEEVKRRSVRVAIALKKMGIKPNDVVMLCCYNDLDNIIPWLAATFIGAIPCSIDPGLEISAIESIIAVVRPSAIFVVKDMLDLIKNTLEKVEVTTKLVVIGKSDNHPTMRDMENVESPEEKDFYPVKMDAKETAVILLTSGTTSAPKGVCVNHFRFLRDLSDTEKAGDFFNAILQKTTMHWFSAVLSTTQVMACGTPKLIAPHITVERYLELVEKYKLKFITAIDGIAYFILNILEKIPKAYDLSSLMCLLLAGSKVDKKALLKLRELLAPALVFSSYILTETGIVSVGNCTDKPDFSRADSVGKVNPNVELKIVDPETEVQLGPNEEGEILVKTPDMMNGYYNYDNSNLYDNDGFFKTGDLGYYDEDDYLFVTDRVKECFKVYSGSICSKISPSLIQTEISKHPDIVQAAIFCLPDTKLLNKVAALVVLKDNSKITAEELVEFANANLPKTHWINGGVKFVKELPVGVTGKVTKRYCRELFFKLT